MSAVAEMRKLVRELEKRGLTVTETGSGHYRVEDEQGNFSILSKSPKHVPTVCQVRRRLTRLGVSA
jgi:hypothetical protein